MKAHMFRFSFMGPEARLTTSLRLLLGEEFNHERTFRDRIPSQVRSGGILVSRL